MLAHYRIFIISSIYMYYVFNFYKKYLISHPKGTFINDASIHFFNHISFKVTGRLLISFFKMARYHLYHHIHKRNQT